MLKKLKLARQITRFYKIFGNELGVVPCRVKVRDITYDFLLGVKYDVTEAIKSSSGVFCSKAYEMDKWLNNLLMGVIK